MSIVLDGTAGITTPDLTDTSLTSGRVVYAGTSGNLTGSTALTFDGTSLTTTNNVNVPNTFGFKNRIINGAMTFDQRNAGASVAYAANTSGYSLDRWSIDNSNDGTITVQQTSTAPTGFTNSLLVTVTSADSSLSSGQRCRFSQRIEGFNTFDFAWGTANAQTITISFWVRSSLTGTFGGAIRNNSFNRSYAFSYTINTANTWEQKTVVIAGDTTGTWATTNSFGLEVGFGLGVSSDLSGTSGVWTATANVSATGATSVIGTNGATFYITGVQLEKGSTATLFDVRPYGTEFALCQRYFTQWYGGVNSDAAFGIGMGNSGTVLDVIFPFKVSMRTTPTLTSSASGTFEATNGLTLTTPSLVDANSEVGCLRWTVTTVLGQAYKAKAKFQASASFLNFSAEL